jgi:hypothetical protein
VVLVCNHVSFVDAMLLAGCIRRPIRFVMHYRVFQTPVLSYIFKAGKAIPIAGAGEDRAMMEQAFDQISEALQQGEVVCIFPEGKITKTGQLEPFKPGIGQILERNPVAVVPLALRGLWGSFFSRKYGSAMTRWFPRGWFSHVELVAGDIVEGPEASPALLQQRVLELRGDRL